MKRKWLQRHGMEFLELTAEPNASFRLYSSFERRLRGKRRGFPMTRSELIAFRDKLNDAIEGTTEIRHISKAQYRHALERELAKDGPDLTPGQARAILQ